LISRNLLATVCSNAGASNFPEDNLPDARDLDADRLRSREIAMPEDGCEARGMIKEAGIK